jgi:hypothetical protein
MGPPAQRDISLTIQPPGVRQAACMGPSPSAQRAVKALEQLVFELQGRHIVMTDGRRIITIPRHDPVDAHTMAGIVRDASLTPGQFRDLL